MINEINRLVNLEDAGMLSTRELRKMIDRATEIINEREANPRYAVIAVDLNTGKPELIAIYRGATAEDISTRTRHNLRRPDRMTYAIQLIDSPTTHL